MIAGIVGGTKAVGGGSSNDPNWNDVLFLYGFNGADGQTSSTSEGPASIPLTFVGDAQLDTSQFRFATASLLLDGTDDHVYATSDDPAAYVFEDRNFTIEMFIRFVTNPGPANQVLASSDSPPALFWFMRLTTGNTLEFQYSTNGVDMQVGVSAGWDPAAETWYHVAVTRDGNLMRMFVDGVLLATNDIGALTSFNDADGIKSVLLGAKDSSVPEEFFNGWIDEFRLTLGVAAGVARYTATFTPPSQPFPRQ